MKVLHIGKKGNMERYSAEDSFLYQLEVADMYRDLPVQEYLQEAGDADFIVVDAISRIPAQLIGAMPNLKMIHSEGVAYNAIDVDAATKRHIYVCNSSGMNAAAVAEQTLLLMVGMLRDVVNGDRAVRTGNQIRVKENYIQEGNLKELGDCSVGLVGFGNIAKSVAKLLRAYGVEKIYYYKRHPLTADEEQKYHVVYKSLSALLSESDIVSLHLPVTEQTRGMADENFFSHMRDGSFFVNTARGELVDDGALADALLSGKLAMAGIDTLDHEPVLKDHPLLQLPEEIGRKIIFSPHIGGITASSFRRSYAMIWEDAEAVADGRKPKRAVNRF